MLNAILKILQVHQNRIEIGIKESIDYFGQKTVLRDSCEYALLTGGKRFRPSLALLIADCLGHGSDVLKAALAIEFFHTASLIADDLPCMDDDDERRNKPSLHKVYGESTALLTSYALIAAGYDFLTQNAEQIRNLNLPHSHRSDALCLLAIQNVSQNTGIDGATGGQWLDLFPESMSHEKLRQIQQMKTVTLFEISFVLGWLYGGGGVEKLPLVKKSAQHFGFAFQIADDIEDQEQDKITGRSINWANLVGLDEALIMFDREMNEFKQTSRELGLKPLTHLFK